MGLALRQIARLERFLYVDQYQDYEHYRVLLKDKAGLKSHCHGINSPECVVLGQTRVKSAPVTTKQLT